MKCLLFIIAMGADWLTICRRIRFKVGIEMARFSHGQGMYKYFKSVKSLKPYKMNRLLVLIFSYYYAGQGGALNNIYWRRFEITCSNDISPRSSFVPLISSNEIIKRDKPEPHDIISPQISNISAFKHETCSARLLNIIHKFK